MKSVIQALAVTTIIQMIAMFGMTTLIYDQSKYHAAALVLEHRNEVQQQFSQERDEMKEYVDRKIQLALIRSAREEKQ